MYAIAFDLDVDKLKVHYGSSHNNAYGDIRRYFAANGFSNQQGSLYYGDQTVTMVGAGVVVANLAKTYPWLEKCVTDIRILRLLESDDLMPAVKMGGGLAADAS